jgi:serine/threonine protein kinase
MSDSLVREPNDTAFLTELAWQRRLDALVSGECSEDEFLDELTDLRDADPDAAWNVVALLDQRYRRGQMPAELFRSIESKIAQRHLDSTEYGTTISLELPTDRSASNRHRAAESAPSATTSSSGDYAGPTVAEVGCVLRNRYVLESRLGSGGMGTVFKALDRYRCDLPEDNRHIAIKFLHQEAGSGPEVLSNLRREFYCAQALSHRSIVKVYELDRDGDLEFFTMELLEGELLSGVLGRLKSAPIVRPQAWAIIMQVGAGLAHAHTRNVVHGDLKPQNIMLTNSGELRILDFGASRAPAGDEPSADEPQKGQSTRLTPAYACCELLEGEPADPRDDLYALACVAYELLAGEHPFQHRRSTEARTLGIAPRRPPGLSRHQWQTLLTGLAWRRDSRSMSVHDWIANLKPGPATVPRLVRPQDLRIEDGSRRRAARRRAMVLLAAAFVCLIGVTMWMSFTRPSLERSPGGPVAALDAPATTENTATAITDEGAATASLDPQGSPGEGSSGSAPTAQSRPAAQPAAPAGIARNDPARAAAHKPKSNKISISAGTYKIRPRDNFAEIRVRRSTDADGDTSFVWWTEPSTAVEGSDYVPQSRVTQILPKGRSATSLFIKIIPNASRKHSAVFYVAIGDPSNGATLGNVARTAILLPPSS